MNVALIRAVSITAALGTAACAHSTTSPTPVDQNATVAGTVWLHDSGGVKPYANVGLDAWVQTHSPGLTVGVPTAPISSGPDGRYSFTVPAGALVRVKVPGAFSASGWAPGYQPCVTAITATGNANLDVHVIVDPAQLGAHLPNELLNDTPTLSGTVFETTALGRQPVPNVLVELDMVAGLGDVSATTLTDSDGRYVLCGLGGAAATAPSVASTYVYALKSGYQVADVGRVDLNGNTIRDIELQH